MPWRTWQMTTTVEKKVLDDGRKHINQFEVGNFRIPLLVPR
jgi:hypothetical protein